MAQQNTSSLPFTLPKVSHPIWQVNKIQNDSKHVVSIDGLTKRYHSIMRKPGDKARLDVQGKHHINIEHVVQNGQHSLKISSKKGPTQNLPLSQEGHNSVDVHVRKDGKSFQVSAGKNHVEGELHDFAENDPNAAFITASAPTFYVTKDNYAILQSQDYAQIQTLKNKSAADLFPIYQNIQKNGQSAWVPVEKDNQTYYISYSDKGAVYAWAQDLASPENNDPDRKNYSIQIGSYSASASVLGISNYVLTNVPSQITDGIISLVFSKLFQSLISEGLGYAASYVTITLAQLLADAGWEAAVVEIPAAFIASATTLVCTGIGMIIFVCIMWLASWMFRVYNLVVEIDNWDPNNDWETGSAVYQDNATISGDQEYQPVVIQKYLPPGANTLPPGMSPIQDLEAVMSSVVYIFENDSKFFEGLGIAGSVVNQTTQNGFMFLYSLPRFGENSIGLQNNIIDSEKYYQSGTKLQQLTTNITSQNLNITATTDYLSNAPNNTYNLLINIGTIPQSNNNS